MSRLFFVLTLLVLPSTLWAGPQQKNPPIELPGSKEVETWLNKRADELGMVRVSDDVELNYLINIGYLVPIPDTICVDPRLDEKWRYVMPQVAKFLIELQEKYSEKFGEGCFVVNSAVRTIPRQLAISIGSGTKSSGNNKPNTNAASVTGERKSLHLTGATIDIGKLDPMWRKKSRMVQLTPKVIKWFRENLLELEDGVSFDVTEEFTQAVFHITVLPTQGVSVD